MLFTEGRYSGPFWPQALSKGSKTHRTRQNPDRLDKLIRIVCMPKLSRIELMTTVSVAQASATLTDARYHELTREVLGTVEACIDRWLDEDVIDIDTHRTGGLLELVLPDQSKIILNTQPPLHELWMAARAGGFHFRFDGTCWVDTRTGQEFFALLSEQICRQSGGLDLRVTAA